MLKKLKNAFWRDRPGAFEKPDSKPMAIPVGFRKPITLEERMKRLLQDDALRRYAMQTGIDTPEEFDDFGDDDLDPMTPEAGSELVRNPSTGREMTRSESAALEKEMPVVDEKLRRLKAQRDAVKKSKKDTASKGFTEEDPTE